ncbi:MAG: substrate-binding domain-containing protein, partial [Pseudomonadota bacterium]|nr:substrate-binding domain-containing protein [Pseudomonadota bacterium]
LVQSNDREMVEGVVNYLVKLGHRRIGLIEGPSGFRSAFERREGFLAAMHRHGLEVPPAALAQGNYRFDSGHRAANELLSAEPRVTAIFASNDEMAAGAYHAARERGVEVPRQLSIVGFDDSPIAAHIWPPMTTVGWPIREMAKAAALKLVAPDSSEALPSSFPARLVSRNSVAEPG